MTDSNTQLQNVIPKGLGGHIFREIKRLKVVNRDQKPVNSADRFLSRTIGLILLLAGATGVAVCFYYPLGWNVRGRVVLISSGLFGFGVAMWKGISLLWILAWMRTYWFATTFFVLLYLISGILISSVANDKVDSTTLPIGAALIMWLIGGTAILFYTTEIKVLKRSVPKTGKFKVFLRYVGILIFSGITAGGAIVLVNIPVIEDLVFGSYTSDYVPTEMRYGFIDRNGKVIIEPKYSEVDGAFSNGMVAVKSRSNWGYLATNGDTVVAFDYKRTFPFNEGYGLITEYNSSSVLIDSTGKQVEWSKSEELMSNTEGFTGVRENGLWGFKDSTGNWVIKPQYDGLLPFHEGRAAVLKGKLWYFIDEKGAILTDAGYEKIISFSGSFGFVGKRIDNNYRYAQIDTTGELVSDFDYGTVSSSFQDGWAVVDFNYMNVKGEFMGGRDFVSVRPMAEGLGAYWAIQEEEPKEQLFGYVRSDGTELCPPLYYDAHPFSNGMASVQNTDGKWGMIDTTGNLILAFEYDFLGQFSQGLICFGVEMEVE